MRIRPISSVAGVIDDNVDRTKASNRRLNRGGGLLLMRYIER
jgi:hypothetical protein